MSDVVPLALLLSEQYPAAVLVVEDGRVLAANAAAAVLLGAHATSGVATSSLCVAGSHDKLASALAAGERGTVEIQCVQHGHDQLTVRFLIEPLGAKRLLVAAGAGPLYTARMAGLLLDTSAKLANLTRELSQRGAELAAAKARLEHLAALREDFVAALSHDIKSPLTAIMLMAASDERDATSSIPASADRRFRSIQRNAERILLLINELLDATYLDSGRIQLKLQPLSLVALAGDVVDSVDALASHAGVQLEVEPVTTAAPVMGDRIRLFRVLANLVGNAIRHSPKGGRVQIRLEEDSAVVRCAVCDQGSGVSPELRERIFERFQQAGKEAGSVGLGLYIVRRIVELHHGRVWVDSASPRGAAFFFELPRVGASR